ncbi:methylenetetrahydrofolate reductase [NAD(P)H] [Thalassobaculum sp. OXR-137]|uniref:methylenetetrahydrofolate reductase [NAD(P)H] n=1 Tax=Thalassobaculum sp. OXR-137 TaxID=3100173 RepID=UPI002AC8F304|nr:methylenetetrahydrofolate reductase [NAD(P)H] [Thalassobaculum sp. OXR-137]WPZ36623.1 methylenetetrahydrofolate reductase [NAD(P)H] [Thalassobaculum sp. OXR-137]
MSDTPNVSFEFFPPKDEEGEAKLWHTVSRLEPYRPSFVSVTYGAGGSTRERTSRIVKRLARESSLTPAAHLTCVGATREEIDEIVRDWQAAGIKHIVALRGDAPADAERYEPHPGGYANAAELTEGLRRIGDFEISVGAYPDVHPDSATPAADLDNLKRKIDAGATRAITQYFFEADTFLRFRDICDKAGITVPVVPGILPVTNFKTVVRFSKACGAVVPAWMAELFDGLDEDPETRQLVAATTASDLCMKLMEEGVEDFHFYTLNRPQLTGAICRRLGLRPEMEAAA